jgi:hypothetical protein
VHLIIVIVVIVRVEGEACRLAEWLLINRFYCWAVINYCNHMGNGAGVAWANG